MRSYRIKRNLGNHTKKTNWWLILCIFLLICIIASLSIYMIYNNLKEYYQQDLPKLNKLTEKMEGIHEKLDDVTVVPANKSYTINKSKIHLCMKDKNGSYYDDNMLTYVLIHELAHVISDSIGHTPEFYENFDQLLLKAEEMGIYDSSKPPLENYCT